MKNMIVCFVLLWPLLANAAEYRTVQTDKSSITFVSRQMSVPVEGAFKTFSAQLRFNPEKPAAASAHIVIELASIDAGSAEANDEVKGKSWFNVAEFPRAEFVSTTLKPLGAGKFEASGKMTIKGKTLDVRAPFTVQENKGELKIDGMLQLNRLAYGIGSGVWSDTSVVADEVQIKFYLVAK